MRERQPHREDYTVGWVCALPIELAAAQAMLDTEHSSIRLQIDDPSIFILGNIAGHNVVITCLPDGQIGTSSAATVAIQMRSAFPSIRFGLMVGIGGGVPSPEHDIRLGDVVVGRPDNQTGGVVQYDFGKSTSSGFVRTGFLNAPPVILLNAVALLRARHFLGRGTMTEYTEKLKEMPAFTRDKDKNRDILFEAEYNHAGGVTCEKCDEERSIQRDEREGHGIMVHYGTIASGNQVLKDAHERDRLAAELGGVLCFEMEAAGLVNNFPCLVIRGICDYADSHKNKNWQPSAAGVAAAYAKELLSVIPPGHVERTKPMRRNAPRKTFMIPFQRNGNFAGRDSIMSELDRRYDTAAFERYLGIALVGNKGIGKTYIALEYAYRSQQHMPWLSVFWIYASSISRYRRSYQDLADRLDLPGKDDPAIDIVELVSDWLTDEENGPWLMILDNVKNVGLSQETGLPVLLEDDVTEKIPIFSLSPEAKHGSLLVTSRNLEAAMSIVGSAENIVHVQQMDEGPKSLLGNGKDLLANLDLNSPKDGRTPLSWAAEAGIVPVVKLLLATGKVDVDTRDSHYGRTPLSWAAGAGHAEIVQLLLETNKVDINSVDYQNRPPLTWALFNSLERMKPVVKLLLATGRADLNIRDESSDRTALSWVCGGGHLEIVKWLLETGKADVNTIEKYHGRTPLSWAAFDRHQEIMKVLIATGQADLEARDREEGRTVLSWAAGNGLEAGVRALLETGKVDVNSKDRNRRTPLFWALSNGHQNTALLLEEALSG
ncbi:ankyrin [Aspergillus welwitschiae]|uniref:Ankyrin n=1 Tax=Aspergillus welwitschiae TaxID=1341132 RepID=A0A3F3PVF2_9EURO|nr:ankyrin [Aspergillus welwitschiae]RDH30904.1 ankyrin [Aspergillus welwitschiae]